MSGESGDRAHSAESFGPERDHWWNLDQLALIASRVGLSERFRYVKGRAETLPFPDASFDMVTCQTVLIHVVSPTAVSARCSASSGRVA